VADPLAPREVARLPLPDIRSALTVDRRAYVVTGEGEAERLHVVDLAPPAAPVLRGSLAGPIPPPGTLVGHHLLHTWYDSGVRVVDVGDPDAPREDVGAAWPGEWSLMSWGLASDGRHVYLAADRDGLVVLRLEGVELPTATADVPPTPSVTAPSPTHDPPPTGTREPPVTDTPPVQRPHRLWLPLVGADLPAP
jgi:hypothetical protein